MWIAHVSAGIKLYKSQANNYMLLFTKLLAIRHEYNRIDSLDSYTKPVESTAYACALQGIKHSGVVSSQIFHSACGLMLYLSLDHTLVLYFL